jgi:hypothetical protein
VINYDEMRSADYAAKKVRIEVAGKVHQFTDHGGPPLEFHDIAMMLMAISVQLENFFEMWVAFTERVMEKEDSRPGDGFTNGGL